ncbi:GAF and ANTAR domain-containing protein [Oerskovia sp. NPDC060287]|uniref:GAF and ANTAR domain-containing protein n=1 Tax=Oerskovia sp. NPDC060287 TaxID=3347095 RepID=UPI00364883F5
MNPRTSAQALAAVTSALLQDHDVTGLLAQLVQDSARFVPADAAGLLLQGENDLLEVLSATSHRTTELELYQAQHDEGPCVDVVRTGRSIEVVGEDEVDRRWPRIGPEITGAGFRSVYAFPLRWHGLTIGGLNLFAATEAPLDDSARQLAQTFADVAALVIVQPVQVDQVDLLASLRRALEGRVVVEQAKGVLAYQLGVDMAAAYDELVRRADQDGLSLTETAAATVAQAQRR